MSPQYTYRSRTRRGTIVVDGRIITIKSFNLILKFFRVGSQSHTLPLRSISRVSFGTHYRRYSLFLGILLLASSLAIAVPGIYVSAYRTPASILITLGSIAAAYFIIIIGMHGFITSNPHSKPSGIKYIIIISLVLYVIIHLIFAGAWGANLLHLAIFSLGVIELMSSKQATLFIYQDSARPIKLRFSARDLSVIQDLEKCIINSLIYDIDKTNLNAFFDRKY